MATLETFDPLAALEAERAYSLGVVALQLGESLGDESFVALFDVAWRAHSVELLARCTRDATERLRLLACPLILSLN
jgi:hypothetical protein